MFHVPLSKCSDSPKASDLLTPSKHQVKPCPPVRTPSTPGSMLTRACTHGVEAELEGQTARPTHWREWDGLDNKHSPSHLEVFGQPTLPAQAKPPPLVSVSETVTLQSATWESCLHPIQCPTHSKSGTMPLKPARVRPAWFPLPLPSRYTSLIGPHFLSKCCRHHWFHFY